MKKVIAHIATFLLLVFVTGSCVDEMSPKYLPDGEGIALHFGLNGLARMEIGTKGTQGYDAESIVTNIYVFIFKSDGSLVYDDYFSGENLNRRWALNTRSEATPWDGTIYINDNRVSRESNLTVVAVANTDVALKEALDAEKAMPGFSPSSLKAMKYDYALDYYGSMPMSGMETGISISSANHQFMKGGSVLTLPLQRIHSKIRFRVKVGNDNDKIESFNVLSWQVFRLPKYAYLLERGSYGSSRSELYDWADSQPDVSACFLDMAEPTPRFDSQFDQFDSDGELRSREFSFYMLENRRAPASPGRAWVYSDRDRKEKTASGLNENHFLYADDQSTYVVIKVQLWMTKSDATAPTVSATADYMIHLGDFTNKGLDDFDTFRNHAYTYIITINNVEDIKAEVIPDDPNAPYYDQEVEPGATGKVVVALEEIFQCDAHYASHVINFHSTSIDPNAITWYVETPFNRGGAYPDVDGNNDPILNAEGEPKPKDAADSEFGKLDYKWVEFRVNRQVNRADNPNGWQYNNLRRLYKPRDYQVTGNAELDDEFADFPTMNVIELVRYLKQQKKLYEEDEAWNAIDANKNDPTYPHHRSDFDNDPGEKGPKISVTAFVNEYYYEVHPFTGVFDPGLWKSFVNTQNPPMRYMHILSDVKTSADKESMILGSSLTIQQQPIQTIYNTANVGLESAWGSEWLDENEELGINTYSPGKDRSGSQQRGNTSPSNGRSNSIKEWRDRDGNNISFGSTPWTNYLDMTADNITPLLKNASDKYNYRYLRWSCMTRNRDNNGNGLIDEDEIRWYTGATNQLIGLFLGSRGISGAAQLYQKTTVEQLSADSHDWRQHVIASSLWANHYNSDTDARVLWAEEGFNGSNTNGSYQHADRLAVFSTRCVRNLGSYAGQDITKASVEVEPQNYIVVTRMRKNGDAMEEITEDVSGWTKAQKQQIYYDIDCSRMNTASLRAFWDSEKRGDLLLHNENEGAAFLSRHFMVASVRATEINTTAESHATRDITIVKGTETKTYKCSYMKPMNDYITDSGTNPFCPAGYRLPNVRELGVLRNFILDNEFHRNFYFSRTYWSFGAEAKNHPEASYVNGTWLGQNKPSGSTSSKYGWGASSEKSLMTSPESTQSTQYVRCVKDIED